MLLLDLGIFPGREPALWFSGVFNDAGPGDVVLPNEWHLLSGFIVVDGFSALIEYGSNFCGAPPGSGIREVACDQYVKLFLEITL